MNVFRLPGGTYQYDSGRPLGPPGGFGQVFAGTAPDGTIVAVKKLHLSAIEASHRELRISEELRGRKFKHVIQFFDSGADENSGEYFVVMPRAERSLQNLVEAEGPLDPNAAAAIVLQIAKGLIEVGDLVHRDLKPANILYHERVWKVADFGIAKFVQESTRNSTLKGAQTDEYAAPEQWRGERATPPTDIYALGCIAFCLLTGKPPFTKDPATEHQHSPVPDFQCADPRLKNLVIMMLRKMPMQRPDHSRVEKILTGIVEHPQATKAEASSLASAAAEIEHQEQVREAKKLAEERAIVERRQLIRAALDLLSENLGRLWNRVQTDAPNARLIRIANTMFGIALGDVQLLAESPPYIEPLRQGAFEKSGWDVIVNVWIQVITSSRLPWRAVLLYCKPTGANAYRWYEIYFTQPVGSKDFAPFSAPNLHEIDSALALGNRKLLVAVGKNLIRIAHGPLEVDDEHEDSFHDRWIWILEKAARGELGFPKEIPFTWPPQLIR